MPAIPTPVLADPLRLAQVFSNLITNAAKYTDSGGTITITLATISDHFVVRIRDTGVGIPAAMIGDIFKKFTQVSHPIERSQGGLGIGLSLVQGLVGLHGGHVQAFSAGEGKGSEFSVFFPQLVTETIQGNQYPDASTNEASPNRTGLRVLVVDDNVDAATTLAEVLELLGHTVCTAHDGPDALSKIAHTALDVVLMDIGLPGLDGYEVAQLIRSDRSCQDLTLIALTGWGLDKDKKRSTDAGFDAHWVKPVDFERLENLSVLRGVR
jgi:CheY-like chemotaxis protein